MLPLGDLIHPFFRCFDSVDMPDCPSLLRRTRLHGDHHQPLIVRRCDEVLRCASYSEVIEGLPMQMRSIHLPPMLLVQPIDLMSRLPRCHLSVLSSKQDQQSNYAGFVEQVQVDLDAHLSISAGVYGSLSSVTYVSPARRHMRQRRAGVAWLLSY